MRVSILRVKAESIFDFEKCFLGSVPASIHGFVSGFVSEWVSGWVDKNFLCDIGDINNVLQHNLD